MSQTEIYPDVAPQSLVQANLETGVVNATEPHPELITEKPRVLSPEDTELVLSHLDIANRIAVTFRNKGLGLEDAQQVAAKAVIEATRTYDNERGEFTTYAVSKIYGYLLHELRGNWKLKISTDIKGRAMMTNKIEAELAQELRRMPTDEEIAKASGMTKGQVAQARLANASRHSDIVDDGRANRAEYQGSEYEEGVENKLLVQDMLQRLDEKSREIVERYYLDGESQDSISKDIGMSPMSVSRALEAARSKLNALYSE